MKKITEEQFVFMKEKFAAKKGFPAKPNPIVEAILALEVGESIAIDKEEYTAKTNLPTKVSQIKKDRKLDKKFTVYKLKDDMGWVAKRLS